MKVEVRLFASLRRHLPAGSDGTKVLIDLPAGSRVRDAIAALAIPRELAQLVMVDGRHETDLDRELSDGAALSVFPPVAGGEDGDQFSVFSFQCSVFSVRQFSDLWADGRTYQSVRTRQE